MSITLKDDNNQIKKGLYIVSTPIGNLKDISLRAIEILKSSDHILCEDTRVSKKLLDKHLIKSKLVSYHKFNEKKKISKIIQMLTSGSIISIISDAGTPNISDPGSMLVNACVDNNIDIFPIPGASAVTSAVSISGFSNKFFFYGFFPEKNKDIVNDLNLLSKLNCSVVFFISPKKFNQSIPIIKKNFKDRKILICREITKYFEEFIRFDINELKIFSNNIKGELTLVISEKKIEKKSSQKLKESDKKIINKLINKLTLKDIIEIITENSDVSRKEIYDYCLKFKNET